ncbi:N-methyl-L-tryptophan oxidase [Thalassoroseus pseudoceratinae]|uniref:N-methyl-L-tryptophan oxidase n=1 Tax=Thalassoroseus pseudoceratinae TaxID=2713176 RepID=UPI001420FAB7|nr:N-methyl-L-tryptophan oxidase [Thalassoroseus pseudoceratinae]
MPQTYDAIVLGVGGVGSAALYQLASRGLRVLGIDRFGIAHDQGSSHGETRVIRQAYFEHPDYVPLLRHAYRLWDQLEKEAESELFHRVGLMLCGPADGEAIPGVKLAAERYGVDIETLSMTDAQKRFRGFQFPEETEVIFEPDAGFLEVENCVRTHIELAKQKGAQLRVGESVKGWQSESNSSVRVTTTTGEYHAGSLIISAGAWASEWLNALEIPLTVLRKVMLWFAVQTAEYDEIQRTPVFYFERPDGTFFAPPCSDGQTIRLVKHDGGETVTNPLTVDRDLKPNDVKPLVKFVRETLPGLDPLPTRHGVCLYTMSPDGHFLVDRHPDHEKVVFAAGLSGHGFKFASVLGAALVDLAIDGKTDLPIGFLGTDRFQNL